LEKEIETPLGLYGVLFRSIIKIMQLFLLIFGILIGAFFLPIAIKPLAKKRVKRTLIERFNNTLRQRVSRLARKTLSFSKSIDNLIGAIFFFIQHYNCSLNL
jgi:hypothetical protein